MVLTDQFANAQLVLDAADPLGEAVADALAAGNLLDELPDQPSVAELVFGRQVRRDGVPGRDRVEAELVTELVRLHHVDDVANAGVRPERHRHLELGPLG
jgi:hypothetical protein